MTGLKALELMSPVSSGSFKWVPPEARKLGTYIAAYLASAGAGQLELGGRLPRNSKSQKVVTAG